MAQVIDPGLLFEHNPEPMWIYDADSLAFIDVNDAALRQYGYSREEFLAMTIEDIRPVEELPRLREVLKNKAPGPGKSGLWRHRLKSGEIIIVDVRSHSLGWDGGNVQLVCARNVTELLQLRDENTGLRQRQQTLIERAENADRHVSFRLGEYETQLKMVQRLLNLAVWRLDLATGRLHWSNNISNILGVAPGSLDELDQWVHPDDRDVRRSHFESQLASGQNNFEFEHRAIRPDGRIIHLRGVGERTRGPDGDVLAGVVLDITEEVVQRDEASSLARRLRDTLESMSDAFLLLDQDYRFAFVNSRAGILLHKTREELLGQNAWEVFPEAVVEGFKVEYDHAFETGESVHFTSYFSPLSVWFQIDAYPTSEGLAIYFRDVTRQYEREQQARISEERFQLVSRATNDVVWDWNLEIDRIWFSEGFGTLFGLPRSNDYGPVSAWSNRIHDDDRARILASVDAAIKGDASNWEGEYRFVAADGAIFTVVDRGFVIRDENGRAVRMVGSMLDISERRRMEERLHQSQKLEAVGQLTGGVAHDFNNLLTVMLGNAELLREQLGDRPSLCSLAEMMVTAATRGAELTSRLLAFARRQPLEPKVVDLHRLVAGMDGLLRRTLAADIDIEVVRGGGLWLVEVDPGQLEVSLLNLAINARDAMTGGGRLTLETANMMLDDAYASENPEVTPGQYVMISVSDTGCGIAPDIIDQVFEPFFTTKQPGKGTGMGLSMVYGFVKQSGGHIKIYSELGEGTTVRLYFPRAVSRSETQPGLAAGRTEAGHNEHILVVEDDTLVRDHVTALLQGLGYRVSSTESGARALAVIEQDDSIDLLFTDVIMPGGINGRQLAEAARQRRPGLRVLFTSGYTENAIVHHGRLDRGVELLSKPYRRDQLAAKIRKMLVGGH